VSLTLFLIVGIYTRRVPNRRLYIMAASTITPFIGLIALSMIPNSPANKWTKWGMYLITVPMWQNRRRDKKALESGISKEEQERLGRELGELDKTDMENPHFRYTM
jgi:hypothetical protein